MTNISVQKFKYIVAIEAEAIYLPTSYPVLKGIWEGVSDSEHINKDYFYSFVS